MTGHGRQFSTFTSSAKFGKCVPVWWIIWGVGPGLKVFWRQKIAFKFYRTCLRLNNFMNLMQTAIYFIHFSEISAFNFIFMLFSCGAKHNTIYQYGAQAREHHIIVSVHVTKNGNLAQKRIGPFHLKIWRLLFCFSGCSFFELVTLFSIPRMIRRFSFVVYGFSSVGYRAGIYLWRFPLIRLKKLGLFECLSKITSISKIFDVGLDIVLVMF